MAIAIDGNSPQNSGAQAGSSASFNLTITNGLAAVLYVGISISDAGTPVSVSSVTYNSVALTLVTNSTPGSGAGLVTYIYRLKNPTADGAAHSVSITLSGSPSSGWMAGAIAFSGVNTTTPEDVKGSNQSSTNVTTLSVSLTTTQDNDWYFMCGVDQGGFSTLAVGDAATQRWYVLSTAEKIGGTKSLGAHGSISPTITVGQGGSALAISAVAIQPAVFQPDEDYWLQQTYRTWPASGQPFTIDEVIFSIPDEAYWPQNYAWSPATSTSPSTDDEIWVPQPVVPDEDYWFSTSVWATSQTQQATRDDEVWIPQPILFGLDEDYWAFQAYQKQAQFLFSPAYTDDGDLAVTTPPPGTQNYVNWGANNFVVQEIGGGVQF